MKTKLKRFGDKYFGRALDFRVRLFNMLAMAGGVVSAVMAIAGIFNGPGLLNIFINLLTAALSFLLFVVSQRTGKYQLCYTVTIIGIFLVLFPMLFLSTGGYKSGMPCFFVFAVVFTVFMLDGKKALLFSVLETVVYIALCIIAERYPQAVHWLESDEAIMLDVIIAFVAVNLVLGVMLFLHFRLYNQQQEQLARQNAELERLHRQKEKLLADVSHEIRTPLTVMSGYAQRARKQISAGTVNEDTVQGLLTIQLEAQRLAELAQQLISTPMARDVSAPGPVLPVDAVEQAAALVRPILDKNGNRLTLSVEQNCPAVHANAGMIAQILVNLCVNAARHTKDGEVGIAAKQTAGGMVAFTVTDNGAGIAPALLPHVFERGISGEEKSGLGLPISKEIVESYGGEIDITSAPGEGTRVTFTLPVERAGNAEKEAGE